jgi:hypothetical protein
VTNLWARPRPVEDDEWQQPAPPAGAGPEPEPPAFTEEELRRAAALVHEPHPDRASFGYRLGAVCIDIGVALFAAALLALLADGLGAGDELIAVLVVLGFMLTWLAVTAGITELSGGATLGKLAGGMRVARLDDGRPLTGDGSVVRDTLTRLLYVVPFFWLVDSAMASGEGRRGLRDRMTGTVVLRTGRYAARAGVVSLAATIGVAGTFAAAALVIRDDLRDHAGDGPLPGYTLADRNAFLFDCTRQLGPRRCTCIYDRISSRLPYDRYQSGDLFRALRDAERDC